MGITIQWNITQQWTRITVTSNSTDEFHRPNDTKENAPHNFSCTKFINKQNYSIMIEVGFFYPFGYYPFGGDYWVRGVTKDISRLLHCKLSDDYRGEYTCKYSLSCTLKFPVFCYMWIITQFWKLRKTVSYFSMSRLTKRVNSDSGTISNRLVFKCTAYFWNWLDLGYQ